MELNKENTVHFKRKVLSIAFSFLFSLTIGSNQVNAHPAVVAFSAAHVVAAHVVATHIVAAHAATAAGAHACVAHGVAAHCIAGHVAGAGAAQAGIGTCAAGQTVFIHGAVLHCAAPCIASHLPVHGSMLSFAQGGMGAGHFAHLGTAAGGFAHVTGHGSMLPFAHGGVAQAGTTSVRLGHLGTPPVSPGQAVSIGTPVSPGQAVSTNFPGQLGAQQGFGNFSIHSQRTAQTYIGSAYYTRFQTYPTKSLYGISQYYGQGSPYAGASTYGTYNSGDLFMGRGGFLPYAPYSTSSVGAFPTGYGIGGIGTNPGITSSTFGGGVIPGYAGIGAPGYSPLATGFGGLHVFPSSAAYSRYLANPGYEVYTGQAGSSIYPSLGATAYSPSAPYSLTLSNLGTPTGSPIFTAVNTGGGLPNNFISQAAQTRLFPTATNNYGYADTVFSSNSFVAEQQINPFSGTFAAALPNTASGNFINSFTGLGLYNSL